MNITTPAYTSRQSASPRRRHRPDYWLPMLATALLAIGLVVVYAISPGMSAMKGVSESYYISKQVLAIVMSVVAFVVLSHIPYTYWRRVVKPLCIVALASAVAVFAFGEEINGAHRWIQVGGISFQSAELIKFALLVWMADFLAKRKSSNELGDSNKTLKPIAIAFGIIIFIVAIAQSDFGSTAVMVGMGSAMMFVAGVPLKKLLIAGVVLVSIAGLLIASSSYRRDRVTTFLNPTADCQNSGYQSCQALIAVGSGGIFGLGLANSVQAYGYLPEAANDSIFAIIAEKFGFIGVSLIIAVFATLFGRLTRIIERAPDDFSRSLVTGMLAWFAVQAIINIGAMIGLLPLKGITLPFISYGGTSLLFVTGALGIAFQISRHSTLAGNNNDTGAGSYEDSSYRRGQRRPYYATTRRSA